MFRVVVFLFLACWLFPAIASSQLLDDFTDGDFTQNPTWAGADSFFRVQSGQLRYQGPERTNTAYLSTPFSANLSAGNTYWQFDVSLRFNPLNALNELRLYLVADANALGAGTRGYFLQLGGQGDSTALRLVRQVGNVFTTIGLSPAGSISPLGDYRIQVRRTPNDIWMVFLDGISVFATTEPAITTSAYLGVYVRHQVQNDESFALGFVSAQVTGADVLPPQLAAVQVPALDTLIAYFNEVPQASDAAQPGRYSIDGLFSPVSAQLVPGNTAAVRLALPNPLVAGQTYTLSFSNIRDLFGNVGAGSLAFTVIETGTGSPGQVVVNEILFDPRTGETRYIELYNASSQAVDIRSWKLGRGSGTTRQLESITSATTIIPPGGYLCLTEDPAQVSATYTAPDSARFLALQDLPAYDRSKDIVTLYRKDGLLIDSLSYTAKWHFPDLSDTRGVSLERLSTSSPTTAPTNWHSAASTYSYGTPGYRNSQQTAAGTGIQIYLPRPDFSPNADSDRDTLPIEITTTEPGWKVVVSIYSERGALIRTYLPQLLPTGTETLTWNGHDDQARAQSPGFYVVLAQATHPVSGRQEHAKAACVLALPN